MSEISGNKMAVIAAQTQNVAKQLADLK